MSETINEMLADISKDIGVDDDKLSTLANYAVEQEQRERTIESLEKELKREQAELEHLKTQIVPDFMDEIGIESFVTSGGAEIQVVPFYRASIPKDNKDEAHKYLVKHGYQDLIKVTVSVTFGKTEYREALHLAEHITNECGYPTVPVMGVHHSTLRAWVRSMAEEGEDFPLDLFGAFIGRTTKLKRPKL